MVMFFCFLLFPCFIVHSSLKQLYDVNTGNLRHHELKMMKERLDYLEKYSNNSQYLHCLLKTIVTKAQNFSRPVEFLAKNIDNLKKQYPDKIEFIVWDDKGAVLKHLTDRRGYNYILGKLYEVLKEVSNAISVDAQTSINNLKTVTRNLNIIRQFVGKIFIPDTLRKPYMQSNEAGPLLSDFGNPRPFFWYQTGNKISLACFISKDLIESTSGLEKISKVLNKNSRNIITGFSTGENPTLPITEVPPEFKSVLSIALACFENVAEPIFENDNALISMSMPQPGIRAFCLAPKNQQLWSQSINLDIRFLRIVGFLLLCCLIPWLFIRFRQQFLSIRWKLTALFLFANLAPLSILGFIAHDYLNNKKTSLKIEVINDLNKLIRDFDARYASIKYDFSRQLNRELDRINLACAKRPLRDDEIEHIKMFTRQFLPSEAYLIASNGKKVFHYQDSGKISIQNFSFVEALGSAILMFCNKIIAVRDKNNVFSAIMSPYDSDFVRKAFRDKEKVIPINMGNAQKQVYYYILGDHENYLNNYLLIIFWDDLHFQQQYISRYHQSLARKSPNASFVSQSNDGRHSWPMESLDIELQTNIEKISGLRDSLTTTIKKDGESHILSGLKGKSLNNFIIAATYPEKIIEKRINRIKTQMFAGAILSLLLTVVIGQALSAQFLKPVHNLSQATLAIGARNFGHRIPQGDEDEFGHLNQVFNRVIEGLGELEVARIVQESLFPGNNFKAGSFDIYGKSVVMTTLGGDYYDCFKINEGSWGIVIGDVAGHGVPAGLMMAMAKAGVLMASETEKSDAATLTTRLHKVFFAVKNSRLKRMMTLQYFVMQPASGKFSFANAGHCFPILVKPTEGIATFIEHVSTPLGISPKTRYSNFEFNVGCGEALILYTDGIAEAKNEKGEEFTFARFKDLALALYDPDPEIYYRKIYAAYEKWSAKPDDDLTLIIINNNEH